MSASSKASTTTTTTATSNSMKAHDIGETSSIPSTPRDGTYKPSQPRHRPLTEIIGQTFPSFDHHSIVVKPFEEESARDAAFSQELSAMLLDVILETHAWASARPKQESQVAVQKFEKKISQIMGVEKEQEQTRERLNEFVSRMKTALAALTGLGL
ncbi:uncharacterized protein BT62DRAFT_929819 [Guyanagaster necrorhizus]|uniref:Uncharacterized protein n=1 Tax=Guyanagaster necrorhizus TaxID=856835 RepID=A0A9P8AUQ9_9AGAR|nr:uncharacterized protein BT62DRAFT_929819 [Guyanagaster necrorhizus MCA 3950]KAG7448728.1 hypothetical protein BT62DRAFT_929819 [Guyanagaster necrorhizus MCA 3950]